MLLDYHSLVYAEAVVAVEPSVSVREEIVGVGFFQMMQALRRLDDRDGITPWARANRHTR